MIAQVLRLTRWELRDVETNDLNLLGLDYCTSPES